MLRATLAILLVAALASPPAASQDFFAHFKFDKLEFQFWPGGLEDKTKSEGQGSAITVKVQNVEVKEIDAVELRHCIDRDESFCSLGAFGNGNKDGQVTAAEVDDFEAFVAIGLQARHDKTREFLQTLRNNVTVDGMKATTASIKRVDIRGAEGSVDSESTAYVDVDARATYGNDPKASKHTILIGNLTLRPGFSYTNAIWKSGDDAWRFDTAATKPDAARSAVNQLGLFSPQVQFENLSEQGLELTLTKSASKGKSPGVEVGVLAAALVGLAVLVRRRK